MFGGVNAMKLLGDGQLFESGGAAPQVMGNARNMGVQEFQPVAHVPTDA
jgi:hypothetical protein